MFGGKREPQPPKPSVESKVKNAVSYLRMLLVQAIPSDTPGAKEFLRKLEVKTNNLQSLAAMSDDELERFKRSLSPDLHAYYDILIQTLNRLPGEEK